MLIGSLNYVELKGTVTRDFYYVFFFQQSASPGPSGHRGVDQKNTLFCKFFKHKTYLRYVFVFFSSTNLYSILNDSCFKESSKGLKG